MADVDEKLALRLNSMQAAPAGSASHNRAAQEKAELIRPIEASPGIDLRILPLTGKK
jgi:hypothetical protein